MKVKIVDSWLKENWLLLVVIALCLIVLFYTPTMIQSAVNQCNNHWSEKINPTTPFIDINIGEKENNTIFSVT